MPRRLVQYPKRGNISDPQSIPLDSGVFPSLHELMIPLWKTGSNVEFRDGSVLSAKGWNTPDGFPLLFDDATGNFDDAPGNFDDGGPGTTFSNSITDPVRGLAQQRLSTGGLALYLGTPTELFRTTGGAVGSLGSGYSGFTDQMETTPATLWSMIPWGDWMFATNGIDRVQVYREDEDTAFGNLAGVLVNYAEIVLRLGQFVLLLGTSDSDRGYSWSAAGSPIRWDPTLHPSAGQAVIRELQGRIIAAELLGDRIAVYGEDSMHIISFVNAPYFFGHKQALDSIGAISKKAIIPVGNKHYGWGPQGIFVTDGATYEYIDPPAINTYITDNLNTAQASKIYGYYNEPQNRVIWFYPKGASTENSEGIGYNPENGSWTIYSYGRSAAIPRDAFAFPIATTATGAIYAHERTSNAAGSALAKSVQTAPLDLGDPDVHKFVDVIRYRMKDLAGTGVTVTPGFQENITDSIDWGTAEAAANGFQAIFPERSTGFLTLKFSATATDDAFRLDGFEVIGEPDGDDF